MAFLLLFLAGIAGGVLGGMGMGGGTALIPILTLFLGVPQPIAQGLNLISFLPMAALALTVHKKNGLLKTRGLLLLILPAAATSLLSALAAAYLPAAALKRGFGLFLACLSLFVARSAFLSRKNFS